MPRMMQQIIVSSKPRNSLPWEIITMVLITVEARPVTVRHPMIRPAMPQATATEMQLRPPFSSASKIWISLNCCPVTFSASSVA